MNDLKKYLEQLSGLYSIRDNYEFASMEKLILNKGVSFTKEKKFTKEGEMKQCYKNAFEKMLVEEDLIYCEGYALSIIPTMHAWCCDKQGNVIDPTWENGVEYYGIPFSREYVVKTVIKRKYYGLIDNWQHKWPLLKKFPEFARVELLK